MASQNMMKYCEKYKNTAKLLTAVFQRLMTLITNFFGHNMGQLSIETLRGQQIKFMQAVFKFHEYYWKNIIFFIIDPRNTTKIPK